MKYFHIKHLYFSRYAKEIINQVNMGFMFVVINPITVHLLHH